MKRVLAVGLAAVVTTAGAAAFFGDSWWVLDLVANFRVQLAVISFGVLVLVALAGSLPATAMAAAGLLLNAATVLPLYLPPVESARTTLTVASFNLLSSNDEYGAVISWVLDSEADVVFLHEGTEEWEEALASADLPYEMVTTREPHFAFGTIALVPPGAEVTDHGFSRTGRRAVEVVVNHITVIGVHPLAPVSELDTELRNDQLRWVAERARTLPGEVMVIGDFNATSWSHVFRTSFTDAGLINTQRGFGPQATWRVGSIWQLPIDNAVFTDQLGVVSRRVGPDLGSDHRPLLLEVGPRDFT